MTLPRTVRAPLSETVREYWLDRVRQHTEDSYAGVTTLAHATATSDNSVFAELGLQVGTTWPDEAGCAP